MSKSERSFAENRQAFEYVSPKAWRWVRDSFLYGDTIYLIVLAGSRNAARMIRFFANSKNLKAAGMPFKVKILGVFSEDVTEPEVAWEANAHRRIYRYLLDWHPDLLQLRDADVSLLQMAEIWKRQQGNRFREYMRSVQKWCKEAEVPLSYEDPNGPKGQEVIAQWARQARSRKSKREGPPFHMLLANPYRRYIGYALRRNTGEISRAAPTEKNPKNRELEVVHGNALFGFAFGFHPNLPAGRQFGLEFMGGASPVDYYIDAKLTEARLAVMGLGPGSMDNKDLHLFDGPLRSFRLNPAWPSRRKRTPQECHEGGYQIVDWVWSNVECTLFGGGRAGNTGIAHVIAERVYALYQASESGYSLRYCSIDDL